MVGGQWGTEPVLVGVTIIFVVTQSAYFVNNVLVDLVLYTRPSNLVEEDREPASYPTIHVLIPVYEEPREILRETLEGLAALEYPTSRLHVYLVTERDDDVVGAYVDDLLASGEPPGLAIERVVVKRHVVESLVADGRWTPSGDGVPKTKATALKYAFRTLSLPPDDVVTVFDSDTVVPSDTFERAVAGLDEYDVVQAKQTVRNHADGWLPRLEAMGMAAWCHTLYAKTTRGPYQLLGKAYFVEVSDLWALDDWTVDAITEDLTLGIDAYVAGYSLGVLDRYVQDTCPADFSAWITQKRRWVGGPYPYLRFDEFSVRELVRFWVYAASNQVISVLNVVGVPAGVIYFLLVVAGVDLFTSPLLVAVTTVNLLNWIYYSVKSYAATSEAVQFSSRREAAVFYLVSNPLTQLVYSMIWALPVALAVRDHVRHREQTFHVTPKQVERVTSETETPAD